MTDEKATPLTQEYLDRAVSVARDRLKVWGRWTAVDHALLHYQARAEAAEADARRMDSLDSAVREVRHKVDSEGTLRTGEVAIYSTRTGFSVQVRRRNGSAVELGHHGSIRVALDRLSAEGSARTDEPLAAEQDTNG